MALKAQAFADLAVKFYEEEMEKAYSQTVLGRKVEQMALPSGEIKYDIVDQVGPLDIDPEKMRPLMLAIGRAVVAAMTKQAEVVGTLGARWRIE